MVPGTAESPDPQGTIPQNLLEISSMIKSSMRTNGRTLGPITRLVSTAMYKNEVANYYHPQTVVQTSKNQPHCPVQG